MGWTPARVGYRASFLGVVLVTGVCHVGALAYEPGCFPKPGTPDAVLKYFEKFAKPLPRAYCVNGDNAEPVEAEGRDVTELPDEEGIAQDEVSEAFDDQNVEADTNVAEAPVDRGDRRRQMHGQRGVVINPGQIIVDLPGFKLRLEY